MLKVFLTLTLGKTMRKLGSSQILGFTRASLCMLHTVTSESCVSHKIQKRFRGSGFEVLGFRGLGLDLVDVRV